VAGAVGDANGSGSNVDDGENKQEKKKKIIFQYN
jgi:hypothetical protein